MITFDEILPKIREILSQHAEAISNFGPIAVNRDLNGKVRLIVPESIFINSLYVEVIENIAAQFEEKLLAHSFPAKKVILYEEDVTAVYQNSPHFELTGLDKVIIVDRLATESRWDLISDETQGVKRIVFFSIKGGVGRSTAMAASAWALAQTGKKVMVIDLDLESPGLSTALLPEERRPTYGVADWMVEDLVDNGNVVLDDMYATSTLSHDGEIYVIPAHGKSPGEYIAKLGRVWMPKVSKSRERESWSQRLNRLIDSLEEKIKPDIILIDSRSGIDEIASSCVTELGANLILLFSIDGEQTWSGYQILFDYWYRMSKVTYIRERLQVVAAMIPDDERREDYFSGMIERASNLFSEILYDEIAPGAVNEGFSFELFDESAPHYPWAIRWNSGFSALTSTHARFQTIDPDSVKSVFGPLIDGITRLASIGDNTNE